MHGAGQRLSERGVLQRHMIGNAQRVLGDDARRDADELGVGTVVEEQIVAEILLAALAEIALAAGSGVERHHAVAGSETVNSLAGLDDGSGQLVAEERRRNNHARVIAAAKDLQVGSAGERSAHLDNQFARRGLGTGTSLDANIFAAVEDCGLHGAWRSDGRAVSTVLRPTWMTLFNGAPAMVDHVFDGSRGQLDHSLDRGTAILDRHLQPSCGRG